MIIISWHFDKYFIRFFLFIFNRLINKPFSGSWCIKLFDFYWWHVILIEESPLWPFPTFLNKRTNNLLMFLNVVSTVQSTLSFFFFFGCVGMSEKSNNSSSFSFASRLNSKKSIIVLARLISSLLNSLFNFLLK